MKITGMSKTRERFPLSPKKVIKRTLTRTIALVIIILVSGIVGGIFAALSAESTFGWALGGTLFLSAIVLCAIIVIPMYFYQRWYWATYYYELGDDFVTIRKGAVMPKEITIPYERIQDVYVDQDFLDRLFGLFDVHIASAAVSSAFAAHIDGVERPAADGLRKILLDTVQVKLHRTQPSITPPAS